MTARIPITEEIRAAAMADLCAGDSPATIAQRYRINAATVRSWKSRLADDLSQAERASAEMEVESVPPPATQHATPAATHEIIATPATPQMQRTTLVQRQMRIADLIIENLEARLAASLAISNHVKNNPQWVGQQSASELATLDEHLHRTSVDILDRLADRRDAEENDTEYGA